MGNFSKDPVDELRRNRELGYVGLRVEQGVPLLDRDLNLLADLVSSTVRDILAHHLGSGIAERNDAFAVVGLPGGNDLRIVAPAGGGACLVAGIEATIADSLAYSEQPDVPALTTPLDGDREDLVYLDVWVDEVDATADTALANASDVAMQTSVRLRPAWRVRVAEGTRSAPAPEAGHAHCPLAKLHRPRGESVIRDELIVDVRRTGLHLGDLAARVERLEQALRASGAAAPALDAHAPELVALAGAVRGAAAGGAAARGERGGRVRDDGPGARIELVTSRREHSR
jgi:hypothetical protein